MRMDSGLYDLHLENLSEAIVAAGSTEGINDMGCVQMLLVRDYGPFPPPMTGSSPVGRRAVVQTRLGSGNSPTVFQVLVMGEKPRIVVMGLGHPPPTARRFAALTHVSCTSSKM